MGTKEYRDTHKEKISAYNREYNLKNKDKIKALRKANYQKNMKENPNYAKEEYHSKDKNILKARRRARYKVKISGLCQICNLRNAQARHHPDYNQPEKVILICHECHNRLHKSEKVCGKKIGYKHLSGAPAYCGDELPMKHKSNQDRCKNCGTPRSECILVLMDYAGSDEWLCRDCAGDS